MDPSLDGVGRFGRLQPSVPLNETSYYLFRDIISYLSPVELLNLATSSKFMLSFLEHVAKTISLRILLRHFSTRQLPSNLNNCRTFGLQLLRGLSMTCKSVFVMAVNRIRGEDEFFGRMVFGHGGVISWEDRSEILEGVKETKSRYTKLPESMARFRHKVYFCGEHDLYSYCLLTHKMTQEFQMPDPKDFCNGAGGRIGQGWFKALPQFEAELVVFKGDLHAVGGEMGCGSASSPFIHRWQDFSESVSLTASDNKGAWKLLDAKLNTARCLASVAVHDGKMYVAGGYDYGPYTSPNSGGVYIRDYETFDGLQVKVEEEVMIRKTVLDKNVQLISTLGDLYALMGTKELDNDPDEEDEEDEAGLMAFIQKLNSKTHQWELLVKLPHVASLGNAFAMDSKIYFFYLPEGHSAGACMQWDCYDLNSAEFASNSVEWPAEKRQCPFLGSPSSCVLSPMSLAEMME